MMGSVVMGASLHSWEFLWFSEQILGLFSAYASAGFEPVGVKFLTHLTPGRFVFNFESVISEHMLWIKFMALRWMPQDTFRDK